MSESGRTAIVTGASRGIGEAIARRLAAEGLRVVLVARASDDLERVGASIEGAVTLPIDVTHREDSARSVAELLTSVGPVHVLVNNAGGNVRKAAESYTLGEWDALVELGLTAPFHWSTLVFPGMRESGFGRIVNVSSVAGLTALPTGAPYAAAKAGLIQLTKNLAREWGPHGITANVVAPWYVRTPLTEGVLSDPTYLETVMACTPSGRLGTPDDVASAVAFLASDGAGWINGACLPLDGGFAAAAFYPSQ